MAIGMIMVTKEAIGCRGGCSGKGTKLRAGEEEEEEETNNSLSIIEMLLAALRKSMESCRVVRRGEEEPIAAHLRPMEIGWPTDVQHVAHVTFDRFEGFQGLPVEFEVEIPSKVPSASASVFGVSAESMQCCYDSRGNSVPIILLLMQDRLYSQGGLKAEGIFRINPENSHEEDVRSQLNRGIVPDDIDVHCLAALIKAWFRELPSGVLDGLSPEQVLQCSTEEEFVELVKELHPTESALLHWVIDLMADVVELVESNKMNARNIAVVFAPNMTQMTDPLTALMHAVQIMNLLKTLIMKTLREREEAATAAYSPMSSHYSDGEIESQQEMDTSCELRGPLSQCDGTSPYSNGCRDGDEIESSSDMEGQFEKKVNNKIAKGSIGDRVKRHHVNARSGSPSYMESGVSMSGSKFESSCLSTSDGEYSGACSIAVRVKKDLEIREKLHENVDEDVEMDSRLESIPWFGIH